MGPVLKEMQMTSKILNLKVSGGSHETATRESLAKISTPPSTRSHFPIPHHRLLEQVEKTLLKSGLRIVTEEHVTAKQGARYFGLMQVTGAQEDKDYSLVVGLRNAHDKSIVGGLAVGAGVHACDNLSFSGEVVIARKHTRFMDRDLPTLIESAMGRLGGLRKAQEDRISAYQRFDLSDAHAHDLAIQALDARIVPVTKLPAVLQEWREPRHSEFKPRNAWSFFNAFTEVLKGSSLFERPVATQALHGLLDTAAGVIALN